MKKALATIAVAALVGFYAAAPASASEEACTPVDAVEYQAAVYEAVYHEEVTHVEVVSEAYDETVIDVAAYDEIIEHPAVTHVEYFWVSWNWSTASFSDTRWATEDPGVWWYPDADPQKSRIVEDVPAWTETIPHEAVTHVVHHDEVTEVVVDHEAYTEQVLVSAEVPAAAAYLCEWYTWDTGTWTPDAANANDVGWDQELVGPGVIEPTKCETTYQQDLYGGTREQIDAVVGDGILTGPNPPEDHLIVKQWHIVSTDACPPVVVEPPVVTPPVVAPPAQTPPDSLAFTGATSGGLVGWASVLAALGAAALVARRKVFGAE